MQHHRTRPSAKPETVSGNYKIQQLTMDKRVKFDFEIYFTNGGSSP